MAPCQLCHVNAVGNVDEPPGREAVCTHVALHVREDRDDGIRVPVGVVLRPLHEHDERVLWRHAAKFYRRQRPQIVYFVDQFRPEPPRDPTRGDVVQDTWRRQLPRRAASPGAASRGVKELVRE